MWLENYRRWQINVQKNGKRRTFCSSKPGRTGQKEANAKADAWLEDGISDQKIKVKEAYDAYIASKQLTTCRDNWGKLESFGRNHILPPIDYMRINDVSDQQLQSIIDAAYAAGLSKKTLCNLRSTIQQFFKYCRMCQYTLKNPEFLTIPKSAQVGQRTIAQPEDLKILFSTDRTLYRGKERIDHHIFAYRFAILTGLRPGELRGLLWKDIVGDTVYISRSVNVHGEETGGKTENAKRHFVLTLIAKEVVQQQWAERDYNNEHVFRITSHNEFYCAWKRYCSYNKLPKMSLYELRHTFVSLAQNLPDGQLRNLVGHSKSMDTLGVYAHAINGSDEATANSLYAVFSCIFKQTDNE